jgi:ATP-dependent phosphoenolpyruvate carboxykinase
MKTLIERFCCGRDSRLRWSHGILDPANTWPSRDEYFRKYDALAARFIENFKLMMAECP